MTIVTITPTGTSDDYSKIQNTINGLGSGDTIQLNGNFVTKNTITLKPNIIWKLNGTLKLGDNVNKLLVTAQSNASKVNMSGGTYDGNKTKQSSSSTTNHCIRLKTTNSQFKDMIIQNAVNDNFTLDGTGNTCERLIGRLAGVVAGGDDGNGLDDKGGNNTWIDCIAEENVSDNWVIKCNNSKFIRCIGRNSGGKIGFGFFTDTNLPTANNNRFEACLAYNNPHSGFSISNNASNGEIKGNFIQVECYNNGKNFGNHVGYGSGIRINNKGGSKSVSNNQFDAYCHDNPEAGILIQATGVDNNTGSFVTFGNGTDIDIAKGVGNNFTVYHPNNKPAPKINKGSNTVTITDFTCPGPANSPWCVNKYCGTIPVTKYRCTGSPDFQCIEDPNGPFNSLAECQTVCKPPLKKYRCTGSPDFQCIEDPNGPFNSLAECQTVCKTIVTKYKVFDIQSNTNKGILILQDELGEYDPIQACEYVCQKLKEI